MEKVVGTLWKAELSKSVGACLPSANPHPHRDLHPVRPSGGAAGF